MEALDTMYEKLISGEMDINEVSQEMQNSDMRKKVSLYLNKDTINKLVPYSEEDLHDIEMIVKIAQYIYNNSGYSTGLTDSEYDMLYSILIANGGADVVSAPVVPNSKNIVSHQYPALRGTLTKVYYLTDDEPRANKSRQSLNEWKSSMEQKIYQKTGRKVNLDNEEIYVFPKFDGVSGIFEMNADGTIDRVLTRGDTETNEAEDISKHFQFMDERKSTEFKNQPYGLKTEIMMKNQDLEYFNKTYGTNYKNTRSIVSGIINSDEYSEEKSLLLHMVPLRVGNSDGIQELASEVFDYPYIRCRLKDRELIRDFALKHRYVNDELRCDGAVIYIIDPKIQEILGRENNKNNFEVAYKFTEESTFSKITDIVYNVGLFGRIAPIAKIKPVKMKGNEIKNVSLGSIGRLKTLGLRKGDKVKILYDIVPYLTFDNECEHSHKHDLFEIPETCPECGEAIEFSESGDSASCINPKCPCRIKGKILNYLNKMNIDGMSYGIIDKLYKYDYVRSIQDLYKMEKKIVDISLIDGFGIQSVSSWIDELNEHKTVPDYIVLGALGIEGASKKTFEKIMQKYSLDELMEIAENDLVSGLVIIPSIKDKTAKKIIDGLKENKKLIKRLEKILTILESKGVTNVPKFSVCFTKIRDNDKEKFIIAHGGEVSDTVNKNTTFLVVPTKDSSSSKIEKAKKYGIKIVPIDDIEATLAEYLKGTD